jgi:hypothetical protein
MPQVTDLPGITRLASGDTLYAVRASDGLSTRVTAGNADQSLSKNRVVNVNSINELVNLDVSSIPNNSRAYVKSYYEDYTDRGLGGGEFYWALGSSATEDSGRYFKSAGSPSAGRWERLLNGAVPNVMMFGAKGSAQTNGQYTFTSNSPDDTLSIKRALSGCTYGWSSRLYFPAATYKITDTLIWSAQQTCLFGDGCINGTFLMMDTGIQKDFLVSEGYVALEAHNANPTDLTDPAGGHITNDIPKIEKMAFYYGGAYHRDLYSSSYPLQNNTNSVLTITYPGETNLINDVWLEGGKHAIRIIGPQGPGLRLTNSTINSQGEAAISIEAPIYRSPGPSWPWVTGGGAGMCTIDNCSTDYRGTNVTGYSWVKVHKGADLTLTIKDAKVEGMYSSGIVNYQHTLDASYGSIHINGLNWNQTESTGIRYPVISPMSVVCITPASTGMRDSVYVNLKNMVLFDVDEVIRDYILKDDQGKPYVVYPTIGRAGGTDQYQAQHSPVTHFGQHNSRYPTNESYRTTNYVLNNQPDELMVSFEPSGRTGWYRVMEGNLSNSQALNYNLSISNFFEIHKLNVFSDNVTQVADLKSVSSRTAGYNIVTKARLFHSSYPVGGTGGTTYPVFFDIFINETGLQTFQPLFPESSAIRIHLERMNSPHGNYSNQSNLISPIFLGTSGISYESATSKYHEVDLTRQHDRSQTNQVGTQSIGSTLLQKDLHLFVNSNREAKLFDAGATVTFAGGGASTSAQGKPIFTNGKLTNIVLTTTGNGYTSFPTITISPVTAGNGSAAFASGQFSLNGGLIRVHVISGGAGYAAGPSSDSVGYSLTGTQDNSITTSKIVDLNVTTAKINDLAVTYGKIDTFAVSGSNIADNGISTAKILDSAITTNKVNNGAITLAKLDSSIPSGLSKLLTSDSVSSSVRRLIIQNNPTTPTTQVLITADEIVMKNLSGQSYLANSPVINLNISANFGAGGNLDTSSAINNTWYGIWGIYNSGSNLTSGVLSRADGRNFNYLGTFSSHATYGFGPLMPTDYSYKSLLGHAYYKTAAFDTFLTQDRRTYINDTVLFSSNNVISDNTYQFYQTGWEANSVNLTGLIPRNSIKLYGNIGGDIGGYSATAIAATSGGLGANIFTASAGTYISATGSSQLRGPSSPFSIPLTGWGFWWKGSSNGSVSSNISVNGYEI